MIMSHVSSLPNFVCSHGKYREATVVSQFAREIPIVPILYIMPEQSH